MRRGAGPATLALAVLGGLGAIPSARADQPHPWEIAMQTPATPVDQHLQAFHNELLIIIFAIATFVLGLLLYVIIRFNHRNHPEPTRTSHNPVIEILWTVIPVLILVVIAIPSFKLMFYMDRVPPGAMTVDVTGHQWYWTYKYPDNGGFSFNSNIVQTADLKPGQPRLLTVDNPLVVPVGTNVRVEVTSTDVIHSWYVPSFGVQEYAVPGRHNHAWFRVLRKGTYYGECNQLCGINHAFMPIEIRVVSKSDFEKWAAEQRKAAAATGAGGPATTLVASAAGPAKN